ncbi:hypothetical protein [Frankia sp. CcWB3]
MLVLRGRLGLLQPDQSFRERIERHLIQFSQPAYGLRLLEDGGLDFDRAGPAEKMPLE